MKAKVMNAMQSFSKALMGPVLFLPIAGMLQALSSVMCNTAFVSEGGILYTAGKFINGGVSAVIGNLGILFCVGVSMSLAKRKSGRRIRITCQLSDLACSQLSLAQCCGTDGGR